MQAPSFSRLIVLL